MDELIKENETLKQTVAILESENKLLREQLQYQKMKLFGRSADMLPSDQIQMVLFPPATPAEPESEPEEEKISYTRKKPGRKGLDPNLPTQELIIDIPEEEKTCSCGCKKACIGQEESKKLEYKPAELKVIHIIRLKYACRTCEGAVDDGPTVSIAPVPVALIPKSIVTPSLVSHILTSKFADALPFYRQEKQFKRLGVSLARGTMASWTIKLAQKCKEIVQMLINEALTRPAIQMDETTIQVMNEDGKENISKSYIWLMRAGPPKIGPLENRVLFPDEPEIVIYRYNASRSSDVAKELLEGYQGYVQTDEYGGYFFLDQNSGDFEQIIHVLCMAHLRRKFIEAVKVGSGKENAKQNSPAVDVIKDIKTIYATERKVQEKCFCPEDLVEDRKQEVVPLIDSLIEKVNGLEGQVTPKSKMGIAVSYARRVLPLVKNYAESPNLFLDNNGAENKIRPIALGRKNWLMANTPEGAHALATWFTIIETAVANGWNPYRYLLFLFNGMLENVALADLMPTTPPSVD